MNKFYVYIAKSDDIEKRNCIYVDAKFIEGFAQNEFDPADMEFSGVTVEANSTYEAHEIYNTFGAGEISWVDEPPCTLKKREEFEAGRKIVSEHFSNIEQAVSDIVRTTARIMILPLTQSNSTMLMELNDQLSRLARIVVLSSNNAEDVNINELYRRIKQHYIRQLEELEYTEEPPPKKKN